MKNKILKFIVFLFVWALIYWISKGNFGVISLLFACLFIYTVDKNALIFLANEFDKNHNSLADNVRELYEEIRFLKEDKEKLENEVQELRDSINELTPKKSKGFDSFYDFIDEVENEDKKAP